MNRIAQLVIKNVDLKKLLECKNLSKSTAKKCERVIFSAWNSQYIQRLHEQVKENMIQ